MVWQGRENIPAGDRVQDLVPSALGQRRKATNSVLHPGSVCKFKGAETWIMVRFTVWVLQKYRLEKFHDDMLLAGQESIEPKRVVDDGRDHMDVSASQKMLDLGIGVLASLQRAKVEDAPKLHFVPHWCKRIRDVARHQPIAATTLPLLTETSKLVEAQPLWKSPPTSAPLAHDLVPKTNGGGGGDRGEK